MLKYIYALVFLLLSIKVTFSQETKTAPNSTFKLFSFEDKEGKQTIHSIKQQTFTKTKEDLVSIGITKSTMWLRVNLNDSLLKAKSVLVINTPFKDSITVFYELKNKELVSESLGVMYPFSKNKLNHYVPTFEIPTPKLAVPTIYIKVKSRYAMLVPIEIKTKEAFYKERVSDYFIGGLLIGGLLLMGIYNLFLFFSTRDFSYVLYVLALVGAILSQGYIFGIIIPVLSPDVPEFNFRFPVIIMAFTGIFCSLFTIHFLEIKYTSKLLYWLLISFISALLFNVIIELLHFDYLSRRINILLVISTSIVIFSSALYSLIKGKKIALYFTIAWTFYLFGMIVFALKTVGILPHNSFTNHFMHIGTFMEVMLLSFALGHKYYLVRVDKERLEQQTREDLERQVKAQTVEIEASLKEKETLLKEVHHRVKNNLQIVISLLDLQGASVKNTKDKAVLAQSKSRVYSMSLIHQKLYQSDSLARIQMKSYLEELFTYIKDSFASTSQQTNYILNIENNEFSLTKAVPLGLIVNELLTNSFKYGLPNKSNNTISMTLKSNNNFMVLEIADTGKGFDEKESIGGLKKSLGLFLVNSLTKQLKGSINRFYKDNLFVTQVNIPVEDYEK